MFDYSAYNQPEAVLKLKSEKILKKQEDYQTNDDFNLLLGVLQKNFLQNSLYATKAASSTSSYYNLKYPSIVQSHYCFEINNTALL